MIDGLQQVNKKFKKRKIAVSLFFLLIGLRKYCRVFGESMLPTLCQGDFLIYKPFNHERNKLEEGNLIIVKHPIKQDILLVKRVFSINLDFIDVRGDNELNSMDSREFGLVNYKQIKGVVEHIIPRAKKILSI